MYFFSNNHVDYNSCEYGDTYFHQKKLLKLLYVLLFLYLVDELVIKRENIKDAVFTFRQTVLA